MKNVFDIVGDKQSTKEIYLERTGIEGVWKAYVEAMLYEKVVCNIGFLDLFVSGIPPSPFRWLFHQIS
jgi:hypothetical protein